MGKHDDYASDLLREAAGDAYRRWGQSVEIDYGAGSPARIDGTVGGNIAVEVESRTSKQVRGAVMDLIMHRYPKKLLILVALYMYNVEATAAQCLNILAHFLDRNSFQVVILHGTGDHPDRQSDVAIVRRAISGLGF